MKQLILIAIAFVFLFGTEFHELQHCPRHQVSSVFTTQRHIYRYQNNSAEEKLYGQDDSDSVESFFTESPEKHFATLKEGEIQKLPAAVYKPAFYHLFTFDLPPPQVFV